MTAIHLASRPVERIWGRETLPPGFAEPRAGSPIGEIWFDGGNPDAALLVKYLFTSEHLSIQVHPDDDAARARGFARGKSEAWFVLEAEPGAAIGFGLKTAVSAEALHAAASDGSIEQLIDWRPVRAGEFLYSPAGTIHAIGAGLALVEIQQNLDLTYRLYDYGRPRELHLDAAIAVAERGPPAAPFAPYPRSAGRQVLIEGGAFVVERWTFTEPARIGSAEDQLQLVPIASGGTLDGAPLTVGSVWRIERGALLDGQGGMDLLAAYPNAKVRDLIR